MITGTAEAAAAAYGGTFGGTGAELGRDAFLQLLITQMRMQDPINPMESKDFIAQLAQFSTVEQLQTVNLQIGLLQQSQAVTQALALVGRSIETAEGGAVGVVEAVMFAEGQPWLMVGGERISPGDVVRVY